jgi:hypothetical protein
VHLHIIHSSAHHLLLGAGINIGEGEFAVLASYNRGPRGKSETAQANNRAENNCAAFKTFLCFNIAAVKSTVEMAVE